MPDDAIERARECLARTMEEFGGDARLSCAADIRRDVGNEYWDVPIRAMLAFASQQAPEGWRLVPVVPTEEMWGGLARSIMMWLDFDRKTPGALFKHLEASGVEIPQWLRDEPEMKRLDHVPSKGTRCVILYRAMLDAAPSVTLGEVG